MTRVATYLPRACVVLAFLVATALPAPRVLAQEPLPPVVNPEPQPCEPAATCGQVPQAPEPPPVVSAEQEPPRWRTFVQAAGVAAIPTVVFHGIAIVLGTSAAVAVMIATLPSSRNADGGACLAMLCLAAPLQGALLVGAAAAGVAAGTLSSWIFTEARLRKRVALLPPWMLMHLPAVPLLGVAAVLQWVFGWGGICCATCGSLCFAGYLIQNYDWPGQNAEFYALRRVGPPLFFCCFFGAQALAGTASLVGGGLASLVAGVWMAFTGRMMTGDERGVHWQDLVLVPGERGEETAEEPLVDDEDDFEEIEE